MYAANASPVIPNAFPTISHGGESIPHNLCFFAGPGAALSVAESILLSITLDTSKHTTIFRPVMKRISLSTLDIFAKTT